MASPESFEQGALRPDEVLKMEGEAFESIEGKNAFVAAGKESFAATTDYLLERYS